MKPKISIICPVFNGEKFIEETVKTIVAQTYKNWELLVMDGGSKDGTVGILELYARKYPNIRYYSESDEGSWNAIWKGIDRANGEFICFMYASDGYLNNEWFAKCVEALDADPALSLVWGIPFDMTEEGKMLGPHFAYAQFLPKRTLTQVFRTYGALFKRLAPGKLWRVLKNREFHKVSTAASMARKEEPLQKQAWFRYWLRTGLAFPDANMIVDKKVFIECTPRYISGSRVVDTFHDFFFNFNSRGYLAGCLPTPANYARIHSAQLTERRHGEIMKNRECYFRQVAEFRKELKKRKIFSFIDKDKNEVMTIKKTS
jgi:glycosyltransferase involved in cell wall biosynthesis